MSRFPVSRETPETPHPEALLLFFRRISLPPHASRKLLFHRRKPPAPRSMENKIHSHSFVPGVLRIFDILPHLCCFSADTSRYNVRAAPLPGSETIRLPYRYMQYFSADSCHPAYLQILRSFYCTHCPHIPIVKILHLSDCFRHSGLFYKSSDLP